MRIAIWLLILLICAFPGRAPALDKGHREAAQAAYLYARTLLKEKDYEQAERWLRTAIRLGEGRAALTLAAAMEDGTMHGQAVTMKEMRELGIALLKVASGEGDVRAATEIGLAYYYGKSVVRSQEEALYWLHHAAGKGEPRALLQLSRLVRWGVVEGYVSGDAIAMLEKAVQADYAAAIKELAEIYAEGVLTPLDPARAVALYRRAAQKGNAESMRQVGLFLISGYGVKQDTKEGLEFLLRSASRGNEAAMLNLALLYRYPPDGISKNTNIYLAWLRKAAEAGQADAQYLLSMAYAKGDGVKRDLSQARRYLKQAVAQGYFPAEVARDTGLLP